MRCCEPMNVRQANGRLLVFLDNRTLELVVMEVGEHFVLKIVRSNSSR